MREVEEDWPIGYGVGLRIKRSSVRIRPLPLRWVLGQGSWLPLSQGEAFTLASISYLAILVKYRLAKKKKEKKEATNSSSMASPHKVWGCNTTVPRRTPTSFYSFVLSQQWIQIAIALGYIVQGCPNNFLESKPSTTSLVLSILPSFPLHTICTYLGILVFHGGLQVCISTAMLTNTPSRVHWKPLDIVQWTFREV